MPASPRRRLAATSHAADHPIDAAFVIYRLEEAGETLLALPGTGYSTRLRTSSLDIVRTALENYGWSDDRVRPPVPSSTKITRMDETLAWILLIPRENYVLRRIVGARCLVSPVTERHLFSWLPRWVPTTRPCSAGTPRASRSSSRR